VSAPGLVESAKLLWPSCQVDVGRGRWAGSPRGVRAYALLPSAADPRLAVPLRPRAAAAAVARGQSAPGSTRAAARAWLMAVAFRTGTASLLLPGRRLVHDGGAAGLDRHLSDLLGRTVHLGIRVGPPRANRKPVLQVVDADGRLLAYAKLGTNPLTDRLVEAETATLGRLVATDLGELVVPTVLHAGRWQGHPLLVLAPLAVGRARAADSPDGRARLVGAMTSVLRTGVQAGDLGLCALGELGWWQRTCAAVDALPDTAAAARLAMVRDRLAESGRRILPSGAWHGDWNPGNFSVRPGAVLVWDWERYETGVPAGFDALHLQLSSALAGGVQPGQSAATAAQRLLADGARSTAPFGVDPADAALVAALYLWGLGVRYAADDQDGAGAAVGRLDQWLLPALEGALAAPAVATPDAGAREY
jgi:hypothetical protein